MGNPSFSSNASASLSAISVNDRIELFLQANSTTSADYYWSVNDGAQSSATNLTTNFPGGNCTEIAAMIANGNVSTGNAIALNGSHYSR